MNKSILIGIAFFFCATRACAGEVTVTGAWVRATAPGQDSAAVSMHISTRKSARLMAVSSTAAERVEIHVMKHENGMMMMREVGELALPANQEVVLGSGNHLMLVGLKQPLKAGGSLALRLTVEYADKHKEVIAVQAEVRPLTVGHDMRDMHDMGGMTHDH